MDFLQAKKQNSKEGAPNSYGIFLGGIYIGHAHSCDDDEHIARIINRGKSFRRSLGVKGIRQLIFDTEIHDIPVDKAQQLAKKYNLKIR